MNVDEQLRLLDIFESFYKELPFKDEKINGLRYYYRNNFYSYSDAICLYCMLRYVAPQKIIEIGSGFSSSVTLDTNELFLDNKINCTFIEPYPDRLRLLLNSNDNVKIFESKLQDIPLNVFMKYFLFYQMGYIFISMIYFTPLNTQKNGCWKVEHGMNSTYYELF